MWNAALALYPGITYDSFVVMQNHSHAIVRIGDHALNWEDHLSFMVDNCKRYAAYEYLSLIKVGRCVDSGRHLWPPSFYYKLMPGISALLTIRRYIKLNSVRWNGNYFGLVPALIAWAIYGS